MNILELLPPERQTIDLLAPPFAGHLHPILAIGREIASRHQVRVISTPQALPKIATAGLVGAALLDQSEALLLAITNPPHAVGSNPIRLHRQFQQALRLLVQFKAELADHYRATYAPQLLIADFTLPVCGAVASQFACRWWTSLPSPCVLETADGPPAYCGGLKPATNLRERISMRLARTKVRLFKTLMFHLYRSALRRVDLHRLYRDDGSEAAYSAERILALGEKDFEFPRTWPKAVCFVGPKLYSPSLLVAAEPKFHPGRKHVLVTLGTHLHWHKDEVASAIVKLAARRPDLYFHFTDGDLLSRRVEESANFQRLPYVDYLQYLARYDAVVHHGGAGIMYYCLREQKPSIVYPLDYDQFDHAARIEAAGQGRWIRKLGELEAALASLL